MPMSRDEIDKVLYAELSAAYATSTTKLNKAASAAYKKASESIVIPTTPVEPPVVVPPVVTTPSVWAKPSDFSQKNTGPKKEVPATNAPLTIPTEGSVVDGINATTIYVNANNVTVRNFRVKNIIIQSGRTNFVAEDGVISGDGSIDGIMYNNFTLRRVEITNTFDGAKAHGNVLVDSCWIHDLAFTTSGGTGGNTAGGYTHNDHFQVSNGTNIVFKNSRFENTKKDSGGWDIKGNAGIFVDPDNDAINGVTIDNCYFAHVGNWPVYVIPSTNKPSTGKPKNVTVKNCVFGPQANYMLGDYGWGGYFYAQFMMDEGLVFENNIEESSGKTLKLIKSTNNAPGNPWNGAAIYTAVPS